MQGVQCAPAACIKECLTSDNHSHAAPHCGRPERRPHRVGSWHPCSPPPTTNALSGLPVAAPQPISPAPSQPAATPGANAVRVYGASTTDVNMNLEDRRPAAAAMTPQAWHDRAPAVASIVVRGAWFRTPGYNSRIKVKEYSNLAPFGHKRGTLPPASFFGPVHRSEVALHEGHFYVAVLVPSRLRGFEGRLSWINIWCSFNPGNPRSTEGVLFAGTPVDPSAWRIAGWIDQYLEEQEDPDEHHWLLSLSALATLDQRRWHAHPATQQRWNSRRALSPAARAWHDLQSTLVRSHPAAAKPSASPSA